MDDKVFDLLEKMYSEFTEFKQETKERFGKLENQVTKIEVGHGTKLDALFDGYKQNVKLLEDIRDEVAKHEEVLIRRIK